MELLTYPNKKLKQICEPLDYKDFNELNFHNNLSYMSKMVVECNGYALAAPQVGIMKRFFVLSAVGDFKDEELADKPKYICNPRIVNPTGTRKFKEGCLSFPGIFAWVERHDKFTLIYQDQFGDEKECNAEGLFATICQHEIDHLNGELFIDKMSSWEKDKIMKKVNKLRKKK